MEGLAAKAGEALLAGGGIGAAFFVIALVGMGLLWRNASSARAEKDKCMDARVADAKGTIEETTRCILNSSQTIALLTASNESAMRNNSERVRALELLTGEVRSMGDAFRTYEARLASLENSIRHAGRSAE